MKQGAFVVLYNPLTDLEPRLFVVESISRGRADLVCVGATDGVVQYRQKVDLHALRAYRFLSPERLDAFRRVVLDLRRQRASVREFVNGLPIVADVEESSTTS